MVDTVSSRRRNVDRFGYYSRSYIIKSITNIIEHETRRNSERNQKEMWACGNAATGGLALYLQRQAFFYMTGRSEGMIRFCIPHLIIANEYDKEQLTDAINNTNKNVKFIKAVKLDCGSVSLDYDHKITDKESAKDIVPHIIKTLDFAVRYLEERVKLFSSSL